MHEPSRNLVIASGGVNGYEIVSETAVPVPYGVYPIIRAHTDEHGTGVVVEVDGNEVVVNPDAWHNAVVSP